MIKGGKFGASTKTGVEFEGKTDLATFIATIKGYSIKELLEFSGGGRSKAVEVFYKGKSIAYILKQHAFYKFLEKKYDFNWRSVLSKRLLPDDSIYVITNNTCFVIEVKNQNCAGSVDEKLQTCDFKKKQYTKILARLNCRVEYVYLLSKWFQKPEYKDTLDYIISVGCKFYFEYIPLKEFGLPVPKNND